VVFLFACNDISDYDNTDVAAIVRGEEITIGDLRFLYPDDKILEYLDGSIKAKLAEQEVKTLNIDVSHELQTITGSENGVNIYPSEEDDTEFANNTRDFAAVQSDKFGMESEKYYEKYLEKTQQMSLYVTAYIEEMIGTPEDEGEEYVEEANELLANLADEHADEIQIRIK